MILCLDVGNTQIHGGVFKDDQLLMQFRKTSATKSSSDEYGLFLKSVLRETRLIPQKSNISHLHSRPRCLALSQKCLPQIFQSIPPLSSKPGSRRVLRSNIAILWKWALTVLPIAVACALFPERNLVVVDFGTATTVCVTTKNKEYLGGSILPGIRMSMQALENQTAKLPTVEIKEPESIIGRAQSRASNLDSFFGQMKMVQGMFDEIMLNQNWMSG
jgi:type III pantothenate kinase